MKPVKASFCVCRDDCELERSEGRNIQQTTAASCSALNCVLYVQVFVKALFDYDPKEDKAIPCKEAGLAFKKGAILQIMSQDDATWWQAKHEGDANPRAGLIPSKQFQER